MDLKQFIYTGTIKGFSLWGKSEGIDDSFTKAIADIYASYYIPPEADRLYLENPDTDPNEFFPIKRKYSLFGNKKILASTNYVGKEIYNPRRNGNVFLHGVIADGEVESPISYFEDGFFRTALVGEQRDRATHQGPLPCLPEPPDAVSGAIRDVCRYLSDTDKQKSFAFYLEAIIDSLDKDNAHICFVNAQRGDELWSIIRAAMLLLPPSMAKKLTFDTHFKASSKSVLMKAPFLGAVDKVIGIYDESRVKDFESCKTRNHEYTVYNLMQPPEDTSELMSLIASLFEGESEIKLTAYRAAIGAEKGNLKCAIANAAALAGAIADDYSAIPTEALCRAVTAATAECTPQSEDIEAIVAALALSDRGTLMKFFDFIGSFGSLRDVVAAAYEPTLKKALTAIADAVYSGDEQTCGFVTSLSCVPKLRTVIEDELAAEARCAALVDEIIEGRVTESDTLTYLAKSFGSVYKCLQKAAKAKFAAQLDEIAPMLFTEDGRTEAEQIFLAYRQFAIVSEDNEGLAVEDIAYRHALMRTLENRAELDAFVGGDDNALNALDVIADRAHAQLDKDCNERLTQYFTSYFSSREYVMLGTNITDDIERISERTGFAQYIDMGEIAKAYIESGAQDNNSSALDFVRKQLSADSISGAKAGAVNEQAMSALFDADIRELTARGGEVSEYIALEMNYKIPDTTEKLVRITRGLIGKEGSEELLTGIYSALCAQLLDVAILERFLLEGGELADVFFKNFVLKNYSDETAVAHLMECSGDISYIAEANFKTLFESICLGGVASAKEVLVLMLPLIARVSDRVKDMFVNAFVLSYGPDAMPKANIDTIASGYKTPLSGISALVGYRELLRDIRPIDGVFKNLPAELRDVYQSAISYRAVAGDVSHKLRDVLVSEFSVKLIYDMLTYFGNRNGGVISEKHILKFLDISYDGRYQEFGEIKGFASKYVTNEAVLKCLSIEEKQFSARYDKEISHFEKVISRRAIPDYEVYLDMMEHFFGVREEYRSPELVSALLLTTDLRTVNEDTLQRLCSLAEKTGDEDIVYQLSVLSALKDRHAEFPTVRRVNASPLASYFAWLFAFLSVNTKIREDVFDFLFESYGDEYIGALCELMTESYRLFGKYAGAKVCFELITSRENKILARSLANTKTKIKNIKKIKKQIGG